MTPLTPCIYCGAPWPHEYADIDHRPECPFVTNLWPILRQDVEPHGFGCCGCQTMFSVGDVYVQVPHTGDDGHTDDGIVEILCLSCAFAAVA